MEIIIPESFLNSPNYSEERLQVYTRLGEITKDLKIAILLEQEIFNKSVREARKSRTPVLWTCRKFSLIYCQNSYKFITYAQHCQVEDAKTFINKKIQDIVPEIYLPIIEDINSRLNIKIQLKTSTQYVCSQCKKSDTTIETVQLRSLDEGSNLRICCVNCGHTWTI